MPTRRSSNPTFRTTGNDPYGAIGTGLANLMTAMVPDPKVAAYTQLAEQRGNLIDQQIKTSASTAAFNKAKTAASTFGLNNRQKLAEMLSNVVNKSRVPLGADGRIDETSIAYQSAMEQARRLQAQNFLINGGKNGTGANSAIAGIFADNPDIARAMAYANNGVVNPNTSFSREEQEATRAQLIAADQARSDSAATIKGKLANKGSAVNTRIRGKLDNKGAMDRKKYSTNNPTDPKGIIAKIVREVQAGGGGAEQIDIALDKLKHNPLFGGSPLTASNLVKVINGDGSVTYANVPDAAGRQAPMSAADAKGYIIRALTGGVDVPPAAKQSVGAGPVSVNKNARLYDPYANAGAGKVLLKSEPAPATAASIKAEALKRVTVHYNKHQTYEGLSPHDIALSGIKITTHAGIKSLNDKVYPKATKDMMGVRKYFDEFMDTSELMIGMLEDDGANIIGTVGATSQSFAAIGEQVKAAATMIYGAKEEDIPDEDHILSSLFKRIEAMPEEEGRWARNAMQSAKMRSLVVGLAYSMASQREGGGKLSTTDVDRAIETIGGGLGSAKAFKAVLKMQQGIAVKGWNSKIALNKSLFNGKRGKADWAANNGDQLQEYKPATKTAQPSQTDGAAPAVAKWGRDANGKPIRIN